MKQIIHLFSLLLFCIPLLAQDTVTSLIISKYQGGMFIEFTNAGTKPVDLSRFESGYVGFLTVELGFDYTIEPYAAAHQTKKYMTA